MIIFEGIDGCGKSTQIHLLADWLNEQGKQTAIFNEPGGTDIGDAIRAILLRKEEWSHGMAPLTELLLFSASRTELVRQKIIPALDQGKIVLLDRFIYSTIAYQEVAGDLDSRFVAEVNSTVTRSLRPNLVILLDMDPQTALSRLPRGGDRIEAKGIDYFAKVRSGYLQLRDSLSPNLVVIDAGLDVQSVAAAVLKQVETVITGK